MPHRLPLVAGLLGLAVGLTACGAPVGEPATADSAPRVVATTSILGDIVGDVVGQHAEVQVLVPPGQDPHGFAPSARQAQDLHTADMVVANGLQLEAGLLDLLAVAADDGVPVLHLAQHLDPIPPAGLAEEHDAEGESATDRPGAGTDGHDTLDPHVWFDPLRMADGARLVAARLEEAGVGDDVDWGARGVDVASELESLHDEVGAILEPVRDACRQLVTSHDSLGYFAARYGFEVVGSVSPGTSSQADPSARDFAALADVLRETGASAVFVGVGQSTRLAEALASEVGGDVAVVELYTGSLGQPGSGAEDYAGMLRTDARRIADALSGCQG